MLVAIAAAGASDLSTIEKALVNFLASLPDGLEPVWNVLFLLAPIVAALLLIAALLKRSLRLLATQALAIGLAWLAAAILSANVTVYPEWSDPSAAARGHTPDFPVVLMTAAIAGLWASWPYVTRPGAPIARSSAVAERAQRSAAARRSPRFRHREPRARVGRRGCGPPLPRYS